MVLVGDAGDEFIKHDLEFNKEHMLVGGLWIDI